MKNMLVIVLLLVSSTIIAQESKEKFKINKNQWVLGGTLNINSVNTEDKSQSQINDYKRNSYGVFPELGYSVKDNFIIGLGTGYTFGKSENKISTHESKTHRISFSAFARQYLPVTKRFAFNIEGKFEYSDYQNEFKGTSYSSKSDGSGFSIGLTPGITYSLSNKILMNANFGKLAYGDFESEDYNGIITKSNSFDFNLNFSQLYFGLLFII